MSAKKSRKQDSDDLDAYLEAAVPSFSVGPSALLSYTITAALASVGPAYLFYSIHQLQGAEYLPLFGAVTAVTVVLLFMAYRNTNASIYTRLASSRTEIAAPVGDKTTEKAKQAEQTARRAQAATATEGTSFALLYNTLLFAGVFVLLGFFILGRFIPATFNYPAATIASAALVFAASRAK